MGYRSIGAIWLPDKAYELLDEELKNDLEENWEGERPFWTFDGWKWYNRFPIIKKWNGLLKILEDKYENGELMYDYVRIGEDQTDTTVATHEIFHVNTIYEIDYSHRDLVTGEKL
jgi:hypothetical protein